MEANELIESLGARVGVELSLDDAGVCAIEADGLPVAINYLPEIGQIVLLGDIGTPPPERLEGLYKTLLAANHMFAGTGGSTLSLDAESGRIELCRAVHIALSDADSFYGEVENFVNTAHSWRGVVADYREAAAESSAHDSPGAEAPAFSANGFMQV